MKILYCPLPVPPRLDLVTDMMQRPGVSAVLYSLILKLNVYLFQSTLNNTERPTVHKVYALPRVVQLHAYLLPLMQLDISGNEHIALDAVNVVDQLEHSLPCLDSVQLCLLPLERLIGQLDSLVLCWSRYVGSVRHTIVIACGSDCIDTQQLLFILLFEPFGSAVSIFILS